MADVTGGAAVGTRGAAAVGEEPADLLARLRAAEARIAALKVERAPAEGAVDAAEVDVAQQAKRRREMCQRIEDTSSRSIP